MGQYAADGVHPKFERKDLTDDQKTAMSYIDGIASSMMFELDKLPKGREVALAITKLEEAAFWAKTSILINGCGYLLESEDDLEEDEQF